MTKKPITSEQPEQMEDSSQPVPEDGIGSRIRAAREARGLSQTAVATRTKLIDPQKRGVSRTVLVGYEAGQFIPGGREIRILCETLSVTPNWLIYGTETAYEAAQASMETIRQNDLVSAVRLALAIAVLRPHERGAFQSLVLSMAGRELGDRKLSALLTLGRWLAEQALDGMKKEVEAELQDVMPDSEVKLTLEALVKKYGEGLDSNFGNKLNFGEDGDGPITGNWLYPEPPKPKK